MTANVASRRGVAELSLLAMTAVWGLTFVMVRDAVEVMPVMTFLAYRFIPAVALVAVVFRGEVGALTASGWRQGLLMGTFLCTLYVFQTLALERTSVSNVGFITGLFVVLTPLFGALFLRQRGTVGTWIAAAVSTVGLVLLSGSGGPGRLPGDLLALAGATAFAWHILVTDRAVRDHHFGALLVVQLGVAAIVPLVLATAGGDLVTPPSGSVWVALAVTSLVASALGFFVQTYAQIHASPARTALIIASEPAWAGFFAFVLAGETLSAGGWLGAALILGAIVATEVGPLLRKSRA